MYPYDLHILGCRIAIWDTIFFLAVLGGYFVFRFSLRSEPGMSYPLIRYLVVVYLSALAAQVFAYLFDVNSSIYPPPGTSVAKWYLVPLGGPKTLYGVIVAMPVSVAIAFFGARVRLWRALDLTTAPMFAVLAVARSGCFLQGCCYGARSDIFGISFRDGSPVYYDQLGSGVIAAGAKALPVIPTQGIEAMFLGMLSIWALRRGEAHRRHLFLPAIAAYSAFRFAIEFLRADAERGFYGALATSQWIALVVLVAVAVAGKMTGLCSGAARDVDEILVRPVSR